MKIVVLDGGVLNPGDLSWDGFRDLGDLTVYEKSEADEVAGRVGEAEIVLLNKTRLSPESLAACPNIRYIGVLATGYNGLPLEQARARGIPVTNVPAYGTAAVAQMVFALLLEICSHTAAHSDAVRAGEWESCRNFSFWKYPMLELSGKTMGIVGFGRIGRETARIANAFGMHVLAWGGRGAAQCGTLAEAVAFDELLARSDVISLHCPLDSSTQKLINRDSIAKMKDGAILINTSRGGLIAESDLAEALHAGKVYAAGVDVVSVEPILPENPLLACENCFITPHIAWASLESRQRLMDIAVNNLKSFLAGNPVHVVNP